MCCSRLRRLIDNASTLRIEHAAQDDLVLRRSRRLPDLDENQLAQQEIFLRKNTIAMLDYGIHGTPNPNATFQFVDQNGQWYTANLLPIDDTDPNNPDFYTGSTPIVTNGTGGFLPIVPSSEVQDRSPKPASPIPSGLGSQATNAIKVPLNDGRR